MWGDSEQPVRLWKAAEKDADQQRFLQAAGGAAERILLRAVELLHSPGGAVEYCCGQRKVVQKEVECAAWVSIPFMWVRDAAENMGAWSSTPEVPILKVWTFFLKKRGIKHDEWALLALLMWCESHKINVSKGAALDLKTQEQTGQDILSVASIGNDTAINVIKPWRIVLDLLKQLKNEQGRRMGGVATEKPLSRDMNPP